MGSFIWKKLYFEINWENIGKTKKTDFTNGKDLRAKGLL